MIRAVWWIAVALAVVVLPGCKTESFCFANCDGQSSGGAGGGTGTGAAGGTGAVLGIGGNGGGQCDLFGCGGEGGVAGSGGCQPTNDGQEICDDVDNDCDGEIDEASDIDFRQPRNCGTCEVDCTLQLTRVTTPVCVTDGLTLGEDPGSCDYDTCSTSWYDANGDRSDGCEYYCQWNPDGTNTTDPGGVDGCGRDDDCDGEVDEDVDVCTEVDNCGDCGRACSLPNAVPVCVTTAASDEACTPDNTRCEIESCTAGHFDVDGDRANGCEYACALTNGGVEICDGLDNDCDSLIDNADPDLEDDPDIGATCFGSDKGLCADAANAGVQKCIAGALSCCDADSNDADSASVNLPGQTVRNGVCDASTGVQVVRPGDVTERCNGVDDDCDGVVDDDPVDQGGACGSNVGTCSAGVNTCVGGALTCIGANAPSPDVCDGLDNDCDGVIDGTRVVGGGVSCTSNQDCASQTPYVLCRPVATQNNAFECVRPASDVADASTGAALACDVPPTPPAGIPQPCSAGTLACQGGVQVCVGSVGPTATTDACGEDTNCDGQLTNQTGRLDPDVQNCGTCGNDCTAAVGNASWACVNGSCTTTGCDPGFVECGGASANDCETACAPDPGGETCNGIDDDCDCVIDDNVPAPTVFQACGVSPAATDAGCTDTSLVTINCTAGGWVCSFPPDYCPGGDCSSAVERCDGKDNDCDGFVDEDFMPPMRSVNFLGQSCQSDDGLPPPGHGLCATTGVFVCTSNGLDTECAAQRDDTRATAELCDGVDNDCDGLVDGADSDMTTQDTRLGQSCQGGTQGICADPSTAGTTQCSSGAVTCGGPNVVRPGQRSETCNTVDDDCDGSVDEVADLVDDGASCGTGLGACAPGNEVCVSGSLQCQGQIGPAAETCNGQDDDCDGTIDNNLTDTGGVCDDPPAPPVGATQPCQAGTWQCQGGALVCTGSILPPSPIDSCGDDTNCDGVLTDQPDLNTDPENCGACGFDCAAENAGAHATWTCVGGSCVLDQCEAGFYDCNNDGVDCETSCPFQSGAELCNGVDDDCNCVVDDVQPAQTPVPSQVCGVSVSATQPECGAGDGTTGVLVECTSGSWSCTFPSGFCDGGNPASCASTGERCDGVDNNCNGAVDEDFKAPVRSTKALGSTCTSEDVYRDLQCATSGDPSCPPTAPPHGVCAGSGAYVCDGTELDTVCTAIFDDTQRTDEACDGADNDCDGLVDEPFSNPGSDARHVEPAVVQIGASLWMYQYEASRPGATATNPGRGNGYFCTGAGCTGVPPAPAGVPLQRTPACSTDGVLPWFNVTPVEVMQVCQARGGFICDQAEWETACEAQNSCTYGYGPRANCSLASSPPARVCNLHAFDFNPGVGGIQDGLLPTAAGLLSDCYADWSTLLSNAPPEDLLYDVTGNLREITRVNATTYALMGGAFNTNAESGATCTFDFFKVSDSFQLFDAGFRCCFSSDPRL